jgi:hypothetical protein
MAPVLRITLTDMVVDVRIDGWQFEESRKGSVEQGVTVLSAHSGGA